MHKMMTTDDIDLVKAFRIHLCDFNIMHIFGSASYDNTVLALSFIRNDYQFLHIGTKYGQLLAYDTNTNVNDDNIWFKGLMNRKLCNETYSDMCEKQNIFLKYPNVRLNKNHNMFEVLLSINDIDVLHIAKWIMHYTNKYDICINCQIFIGIAFQQNLNICKDSGQKIIHQKRYLLNMI